MPITLPLRKYHVYQVCCSGWIPLLIPISLVIINASCYNKPTLQLLGLCDYWKGLGGKDQSLRLGSLETGSEDLCVEIYWSVLERYTCKETRKGGLGGGRSWLAMCCLEASANLMGSSGFGMALHHCPKLEPESQAFVSMHQSVAWEDITLGVDLPHSEGNSQWDM